MFGRCRIWYRSSFFFISIRQIFHRFRNLEPDPIPAKHAIRRQTLLLGSTSVEREGQRRRALPKCWNPFRAGDTQQSLRLGNSRICQGTVGSTARLNKSKASRRRFIFVMVGVKCTDCRKCIYLSWKSFDCLFIKEVRSTANSCEELV